MNLKSKEDSSLPEYFIVPSSVVKERTIYSKHANSEFYSLYRKDILDFKDKWDVFGDPRAEQRIEDKSVSKEVRASNANTP